MTGRTYVVSNDSNRPSRCPIGESREGKHERYTAASRGRKADNGQRAAAAHLARPPARLGAHLGDCLCRSLCGGILRLRRLSHRLWTLDGQTAVALCTPPLRPALHKDGDQYPALRRPRRERKNVPGLAAVRLFYHSLAVDQGR